MLFTVENENQKITSFLDVHIIGKDKTFTTFVHVEFMHIFTAFYHLPRNLVLFTHSFLDVSR